METRLVLAYSLMMALALLGATIAFHRWYSARDRSIARQRQRETVRREQRMAEKAAPPLD